MEAAAAGGARLVRFATTRQGIPGTAPRLRLLTRRASALGLTILVEGSTRSVGLAMMGLGATVIFLDQHFYDAGERSEEHTSALQSRGHLVCRLLLEKKKYSEQRAYCDSWPD